MTSTVRALCLSLALAASAVAQPMSVTTIAGSTSGGGYLDAHGEAARFSYPHSIVFDSAGNLFVGDRGNHVIRKITPSGEVSTFAGSPGVSGSANGTGSTARFYHPSGLTIDPATDVLYVADSWNHTIRAITPAGVVSTVAGSAGRSGSTDGTGSEARFAFPQGLAVDQSGFLWVADTSNHKIRRIVGNTVTTFAGLTFSGFDDGDRDEARFNFPFDVAVDRNGDLYVADGSNNAIRKVTREGITSTIAGIPYEADLVDGNAQTARFDDPWGVEVAPNGDVYVADSSNNAIRRINASGNVTTVAGNGSWGTRDGTGAQARFAFPTGLAFHRDGRLFIADRGNFAIRRMSTTAFDVTTFAGSRVTSGFSNGRGLDARFFYPSHAVVDGAGNIYLVDGNAVRRIAVDGTVTTIAGDAASGSADGTGSAARFASPSGIAMDSAGNLWIADTSNHTIRKVTQSGVVTTVAGLAGTAGKADGAGTQARFNYPWGLAFDANGNLYVADTSNHLVRIMTPSGVVTAFAGSGSAGSSDSTALSSSFRYPIAIAVDASGALFVADWGNHSIRRISGGRVTTFAGSSGTSGDVDATGTAARFNNPYGLAIDRTGALYVADTDNHAIRRITPSGVVTTVLGNPGSPGNTDGSGSGARLYLPGGIAVDASGGVIVLDTYNHAIKRASFAPPVVVRFTVSRNVVKAGEAVQLSWEVTGATSVSIDHDVGTVSATGSRNVGIVSTRTFTLTATGLGGTTTAQVTVWVGTPKRRSARH